MTLIDMATAQLPTSAWGDSSTASEKHWDRMAIRVLIKNIVALPSLDSYKKEIDALIKRLIITNVFSIRREYISQIEETAPVRSSSVENTSTGQQ